MTVTISQSGNHRTTIKVPATSRVISTIKAPVHPQKGTKNPPHIHIKIPKSSNQSSSGTASNASC